MSILSLPLEVLIRSTWIAFFFTVKAALKENNVLALSKCQFKGQGWYVW